MLTTEGNIQEGVKVLHSTAESGMQTASWDIIMRFWLEFLIWTQGTTHIISLQVGQT